MLPGTLCCGINIFRILESLFERLWAYYWAAEEGPGSHAAAAIGPNKLAVA